MIKVSKSQPKNIVIHTSAINRRVIIKFLSDLVIFRSSAPIDSSNSNKIWINVRFLNVILCSSRALNFLTDPITSTLPVLLVLLLNTGDLCDLVAILKS